MAVNPIRMKEATVEIKKAGTGRLTGSFLTITDFTCKPVVKKEQLQYIGDKRARGDMSIDGYEFSFKLRKTDRLWWALWREFEAAEEGGSPFPELTIAVTGKYRDGTGRLHTLTLHEGLILSPDDDSLGGSASAYQETSWSGFCARRSETN